MDALTKRHHGPMQDKGLKTGDHIDLRDGYDFEPAWLGKRTSITGLVSGFIPGQNDTPAAVVTLDEMLGVNGLQGRTVVLELRHVGATWASEGIVHIELCDFEPEHLPSQDRRKGMWVESHATYKVIG